MKNITEDLNLAFTMYGSQAQFYLHDHIFFLGFLLRVCATPVRFRFFFNWTAYGGKWNTSNEIKTHTLEGIKYET